MRRKARRRGKIALLVAVAILICDVPSILYAKTTQEKLDEKAKGVVIRGKKNW